MELDLEDLLTQARAGSEKARGQLFERYRNYLTLLARVQIGRRLQGKVDPLDVVQETFLTAHRDFARFRGKTEGELLGWLRQMLAADLADVARRYTAQRRDVRLERRLSEELEQSSRDLGQALIAVQSSPSQRAARREQAVLLADMLETLPPDYAEVLVLHHLESLTFPEVAARMGRTVDSVKKLWTRGLARMRRNLSAVP
jgi:RNA polymerase sigma-70 factor (ECF subfamily)